MVLVAKNIPFEVLYDQDRKSYSLVGTDFNNYPTFLTLSDGTNCRIIRVGRPLVRDVKVDDEGEGAAYEISAEHRSVFSEEEELTLTQFLSLHGAIPVFLDEDA